MRLTFLRVSYGLALRELVRMRIGVVLLFVIPTLFFVLVDYTTTEESVDFIVSSISEKALISSTARGLSLVFTGVAAVGFVTSFLAMTMIQREADVNRRLVLCGYRASEVIVSKVAALVTVTVVIGIYVATILLFFFRPGEWPAMALGFVLGGYVYGAYGLLIGSICRRQLEGILLIVLLANIDAGWLQNPLYYTAAQNTALIRRLPAFYPSQVALVSAFASEFSIGRPLAGSLIYGSVLLAAALFCFAYRMRGGRVVTLPGRAVART